MRPQVNGPFQAPARGARPLSSAPVGSSCLDKSVPRTRLRRAGTSRSRQQVEVGAVENLELDVPVEVERDDTGNARVSILVAANGIPTDDDIEAGRDRFEHSMTPGA